MNSYQFIFSDQKKIRFQRHFVFWVLWCLYFALTFLVPTYWVPAWNLNGRMPQIEQYGVLVSALRIAMNSILMTVVHMALVYGILYFILPGYLSKNKSWISTTFMLLLFVIFIACFNYLNFLLTFYISTRMGYFSQMPGMEFILPIWARQILFNYPTVVGFAVAIKLLKRWYLKQKETEQVAREKINAELQLLKAQVHPHFLFNTLNNLYSFTLNNSPEAPELIKKLSRLLHYILDECNTSEVPLEKELSMIRNYMELEQIRYGGILNMGLHIEGDTTNKMICPLLLIPFIENSFKHGTSQMLTHPFINVDINIDNQMLHFKVSNNKPERNKESSVKKGIGLTNVRKRLQLLYPDAYDLNITENEMSFEVYLKLQLHSRNEFSNKATKEKTYYEVA